MAIEFSKKAYPGRQPAFYREECKILPGDFALKQTFPDGTLIERGTPLQLDYSTGDMKAAVVKIAQVVAGGTTSKPRVTKGSCYVGGETVMKLGKTDTSVTVSSIDKSNASYDELTLSGAIAGLTTGDFLQEASFVETVAAVNGVYTLTIGTNATADDKLTVNGVDYIFAAAAAEGKIAIGATAIATAANLQDTLEADNQDFVVKANGAKLVFTQKVAGTGAIPAIEVVQTGGGTLAASIAQTTAGVAASGGAAPLYVADAVVAEHKEIQSKMGFPTVAAGYEALVLRPNVYPIPDSWLQGCGLKNNQSIKYIKQ